MAEDKFAPSAEYREKERETAAIRKDITAAQTIIREGLLKYKKKMLHARSKKQADDLSVFDVLNDYSSMNDIQNAYGYDVITESEYDRLRQLWEAREQFIDENGKFNDRVTQMLEQAIYNCGESFFDQLEEFDETKSQREKDIARIKRENESNDYRRYVAGIKNDTQ